jgi:hypothetical protein
LPAVATGTTLFSLPEPEAGGRMRMAATGSEQAMQIAAAAAEAANFGDQQALEAANKSLGSLGRWPSSASYSPNWIIPFQELVRVPSGPLPCSPLPLGAVPSMHWRNPQNLQCGAHRMKLSLSLDGLVRRILFHLRRRSRS